MLGLMAEIFIRNPESRTDYNLSYSKINIQDTRFKRIPKQYLLCAVETWAMNYGIDIKLFSFLACRRMNYIFLKWQTNYFLGYTIGKKNY